ncbi:MAG: glycosyltransferase family 2 protein [Clostridia bacterium]|nr:glycosyltransferase family 2 protein [Clostridia bacterium]
MGQGVNGNNIQKLLTVFTPTYNRAYCLDRGYEALKRQTCKDFVWLIVDDGSTDNTAELVKSWQEADNDFEIRYVYKENGGLYTGYTTAFKYIETELCVCVDSDDYLTDNAVELIRDCWKKRGSDAVAGILGLDCTMDGQVIGDLLPDQDTINLIDIHIGKYFFQNGDRKNVVRSELYRRYMKFEEVNGEKDYNPHFLHLAISKDYDFLVLNEKLCVVEYQPGGMTATVFKQYLRSPKSFRIMRQMELSLPGRLPFLIKKTIHYDSSCILSGEPCLSGTPHKLLAVLCWPLGRLFTMYLKWKLKRDS